MFTQFLVMLERFVSINKQFDSLAKCYLKVYKFFVRVKEVLWSFGDIVFCVVLKWRKHNENSVIVNVLPSKGISVHIHKFLLGEWALESEHRTLYIDLKFIEWFGYMKLNHICVDFKKTYLYAKIVEGMS